MDFEEILMLIITTVLVPLLSWGVARLTALADAKIAQIKNDTVRAAFMDARKELVAAVQAAVGETQQIYVDAIKKEGKFDKAAAERAFELARDRTIQIMSNAGMQIIEGATGAANELIAAEIEKTVGEMWP